MKEITVNQNDIGLTYAIKRELMNEGADENKLKKASVWNQILELVDQQQEENSETDKLYSGGNDKTRAGWGSSYMVAAGKILKFSNAIWAKIKEAAGATVKQADANAAENTEKTDKTKAAQGAEETDATEANKGANKPASVNEINFTVQNTNRNNGADIAKDFKSRYKEWASDNDIAMMESALKRIRPENAAYVVESIPDIATKIDDVFNWGDGFDKEEVYKYVLTPLAQRLKALGSTIHGKDPVEYANSIKDDLDQMKTAISTWSKYIINEDTKEIQTQQDCFDKANDLLVKIANMNPPPEVKIEYNQGRVFGAQVVLDNGQSVWVSYNDGKISDISISYDTTLHTLPIGEVTDQPEVTYNANFAICAEYTKGTPWSKSIYKQHDFEALKEVAKKIFEEY